MDEKAIGEQRTSVAEKALYVVLIGVGILAGFALNQFRRVNTPAHAQQVIYYQDPMHPGYRSDHPGKAPDCGMDLVPVYAKDVTKALASGRKPVDGTAQIDGPAQAMYGIKLATVEQEQQGKGSIRAFARVVPDETRIYRINFGTDGYVKETRDDTVGNFVKKNQRLATVYSPEFLAVAGGYLAAHERDPVSPVGGTIGGQNVSQEAASVQARADRLRNLGMSDTQIDEITHTRKLPEDVYVVSPTNGFILSRNVSPGMRFQKQADLYSVADLSEVWIEAEVFARDAQFFRPGKEAVAILTETGQQIRARVADVLPEVDPKTRTFKVRLVAQNPGFKLRPNMFVTVELPAAFPDGLSVPTDAIVNTGLTKRVFVQVSEGMFEPRAVKTGWQVGDRVQIVSGLQPGDIVVSSGTFLVDSESRLHSGETAISQAKGPESANRSKAE